MRLSSAAVLLLVVAAIAVVGGLVASGRAVPGDAAARAPTVTHRASPRPRPGLPGWRTFSDPRFAISFDYPAPLHPEATRPHGREFGHRIVASTALYDQRLGYIEITRADDELDRPALDTDAARLTRLVARIVRRTAPRVPFTATAHAIDGLPVAELRALGTPHVVPLNVFTWAGRDGYRLTCNVPADRALRRQMIGICRAAMRSLRPRVATATPPRARGHA